MFGKLVLLILVLGGVSAAMLVDRQQRLDLAAEMQRTPHRAAPRIGRACSSWIRVYAYFR